MDPRPVIDRHAHGHRAGGQGGLHAAGAVLKYDLLGGVDAHPRGRHEEHIRGGLLISDVFSQDDPLRQEQIHQA